MQSIRQGVTLRSSATLLSSRSSPPGNALLRTSCERKRSKSFVTRMPQCNSTSSKATYSSNSLGPSSTLGTATSFPGGVFSRRESLVPSSAKQALSRFEGLRVMESSHSARLSSLPQADFRFAASFTAWASTCSGGRSRFPLGSRFVTPCVSSSSSSFAPSPFHSSELAQAAVHPSASRASSPRSFQPYLLPGRFMSSPIPTTEAPNHALHEPLRASLPMLPTPFAPSRQCIRRATLRGC